MRRHSIEQYVLSVMSGRRRGPGASALRGVMAAAEPVYRAIVGIRNRRFDAGQSVRRLPRAVVSVGNLTAGGTGKTPVVRWLCERLLAAGRRPAVLTRGYKSAGGVGDEQRMLEAALNVGGRLPVVVHADPDRYAGGTEVLAAHPEVDAFVLDDGFQHRRLARDFDLVLVSAPEPFGFGHVHPRGLLREPLAGLRRAGAVLVTRVDEVGPGETERIEATIRRHTDAPIFHASHAPVRLKCGSAVMPIDALKARHAFAFCGLANPHSFFRQVGDLSAGLKGSRAFPDHHPYDSADWASLHREAVARGAEVLVATEKDWVKLDRLPAGPLPVWRVEIAIRFREGDEEGLTNLMLDKMRMV